MRVAVRSAPPAHPERNVSHTLARVRIPPEAAGMRLDQALARVLPEHSRSRLKTWIDADQVSVDGASWDAKRRVSGGEHVEIAMPVAGEAIGDRPQEIALDVVHDDAQLIVINKPAGLVVHPGSGNRDGTLLNALLHRYPALAGLPRAGIVHRLDKETSGLMVIAKTLEAHTNLVRQLAERSVTREYLGVARGDVTRATIIDAPIGRHPTQRTTMAVVTKGKPARTHVAVVERFGVATTVRCTLETGRTHQIRVHLAAIGHALVGDPVYGPRRTVGVPAFTRQALHAARLALTHPHGGRLVAWDAPPPNDLAALIDALRATYPTRAR